MGTVHSAYDTCGDRLAVAQCVTDGYHLFTANFQGIRITDGCNGNLRHGDPLKCFQEEPPITARSFGDPYPYYLLRVNLVVDEACGKRIRHVFQADIVDWLRLKPVSFYR